MGILVWEDSSGSVPQPFSDAVVISSLMIWVTE